MNFVFCKVFTKSQSGFLLNLRSSPFKVTLTRLSTFGMMDVLVEMVTTEADSTVETTTITMFTQ